jgi:hypothetical protein
VNESPREAPQVLLRDRSIALVRTVSLFDKALIRAGFDRRSEESRYRRFLTPTSELTEPVLRYLTEVDHHDHEALVAVDPESGDGVGIARFVRTGASSNAEVAVTVVGDWQGRASALSCSNCSPSAHARRESRPSAPSPSPRTEG